MKRAILTAVIVATALCCFARTSRVAVIVSGDTDSTTALMTPEMLTEIMNAVGLQQNFELKEAKVLNIEASISHGKRYIYYNPDFVSWINQVTKSKWAAMALLAHEVGHHLNGHTIRKGGSKPELELEADEFAGFVLHRLGASLQDAQEVMKYIAHSETSATHPGRDARMLAIQNGWDRANENGLGSSVAKTGLSATPSKGAGN